MFSLFSVEEQCYGLTRADGFGFGGSGDRPPAWTPAPHTELPGDAGAQQRGDILEAVGNGAVEGRDARLGSYAAIRAARQQQFDDVAASPRRGIVQRRRAGVVACIDIRATVQEQRRHVAM